ncbi:MAG: PIN domain protein [Dyadobacter sp. 50-39]|uniref:type II toxin-antitoxin system VapC family toxin n=1 Tax=Dyadobacter sp. 50-39 TaxID=1895756 RepID=UPI0009607A46|nr:type II toxin-antitoxin system VapC family toxin [Dyadobacter sp. 50-39]OJV20323.1 MAG: PIN domain protein [Dyadobacter sp. 50-39]
MPPRYYLDTSVFGGIFDREFGYETRILFDRIEAGEIKCVYSGLVEAELKRSPERVRRFFQNLNGNNLEKIEVNQAIFTLARKYIEENVVGPTSLDDCIHIALATFYEVDMLVSWNFKHIVNPIRIPGYNSVNLQLAYKSIEIRSPKEVMNL